MAANHFSTRFLQRSGDTLMTWGRHRVPGSTHQKHDYIPEHTVTLGNGWTSTRGVKPANVVFRGTVTQSRLRNPLVVLTRIHRGEAAA